MTEYMVITELFDDRITERWYYGTWADRARAEEVAAELGHGLEVDHIVIRADEARDWDVQNLPD
jgi:hypothetical protein